MGLGIYDVHSPRVPSTQELVGELQRILQVLPPERIWVNPDCGLKTRRWEEIRPALDQMGERRAYFLPTSCFQSTVRIDPYPLRGEDLEDTLQFSDQFLRARHARRVDIIDAKTHVICLAIGDEGL